MSVVSQFRSLEPDSRNAFISALLGWTMDAFDYFLVVLVYAEIAKDFGVSLERMAFLTTVSRRTATSESATACGTSTGNAEVMAATPATTDTATVST